MELERELAIAVFRQQINGMTIEELRSHATGLYELYLGAISPCLWEVKPAPVVGLKAIAPEGIQFTELEFQILEVIEVHRLQGLGPMPIATLVRNFGVNAQDTIAGLHYKQAIFVNDEAEVLPLVEFELFEESRS